MLIEFDSAAELLQAVLDHGCSIERVPKCTTTFDDLNVGDRVNLTATIVEKPIPGLGGEFFRIRIDCSNPKYPPFLMIATPDKVRKFTDFEVAFDLHKGDKKC